MSLKAQYRKPLVDSTPTDMWEGDAIKRFTEGLKVAASCAREMQALAPREGWGKVMEALNGMIVSGGKLARAKGVTRQALLQHAAQMQNRLDTGDKA